MGRVNIKIQKRACFDAVRHIDGQTDRQTYKKTDTCRHIHTGLKTNGQKGRQTDR